MGPVCKHLVDQMSVATQIPAPLIEQLFQEFLGWPHHDTLVHSCFQDSTLFRGKTDVRHMPAGMAETLGGDSYDTDSYEGAEDDY